MKNHYLLDTCAWLDAFTAPEKLKSEVLALIHRQQLIHLSSISLLEVARKEARGQLAFGMPLRQWLKHALPANQIKVHDLSPEIAEDATRLPDWEHRDPADQVITATARVHGLIILTSDVTILSYPHARSVATRG